MSPDDACNLLHNGLTGLGLFIAGIAVGWFMRGGGGNGRETET